MAMQASEIEAMIREALPDADVEIKDLAGDGDQRNQSRQTTESSETRRPDGCKAPALGRENV